MTSLSLPLPVELTDAPVDLREMQRELEEVAAEALAAKNLGVAFSDAARDPRFPALGELHSSLRDAMFLEIPSEAMPFVEHLTKPQAQIHLENLSEDLVRRARGDDPAALSAALSEFLIFQSIRLRLLVTAWSSEEFERLGGDEADVDAIAWGEVQALLPRPEILEDGVRPMNVMFASAAVALAQDAAERAAAMHQVSADLHEQLNMQARLRGALRELRLPESVLLENALSALLGGDRMELPDLQDQRPLALAGMSRQAMDQRVSRGRRALTSGPDKWPRRKRPALFDLVRERTEAKSPEA